MILEDPSTYAQVAPYLVTRKGPDVPRFPHSACGEQQHQNQRTDRGRLRNMLEQAKHFSASFQSTLESWRLGSSL